MNQRERYQHVPECLRKRNQWVCFLLVDNTDKGKADKIPIDPRKLWNASCSNPETWADFDTAVAAVGKTAKCSVTRKNPETGKSERKIVSGKVDGIGFEFADGIFGVDLDHVLQDGKLTPQARDIVDTMDSYTEISPSGTGVHILCEGEIPDKDRRKGDIEMYSGGRFFTVTGQVFESPKEVQERTEQARHIHAKYLKRDSGAKPKCAAASLPLTDNDIIIKASQAKNGLVFQQLWNGDASGYPSQSEADLALCNLLAYWTNGDAARMDSLFRSCGLFREEKWDKVHGKDTYGNLTIQKALQDFSPYSAPSEPYSITIQQGKEEKSRGTPCDEAFRARFARSGYTALKGRTHQIVLNKNWGSYTEEYKLLCNFVAWCEGEKTVDDGVETHKFFTLRGVHASGRPLPEIDVTAAEFSGMAWITKLWGFHCNLNAGTTIKDKLRHCIQQISGDLKQETVYTYTGWRQHNGHWIYLHSGGAVGAEGIRVELEGKLQNYAMPAARPEQTAQAVQAAIQLEAVAPERITLPLLSFVFLSPLNEFLKQAGYEPKFVSFLMGKTGTGKSTLTALLLSFFGRFNNTDLPLSFMDTPNAIINQVFLAKDNLICIDDYKPSTRSDVNKMDNVAQTVLRAYGERTGRNRLRSDSTLMRQRIPRGNAIITGEQPPNVGESGTARFIVLELVPGDLDFQTVTEAQRKAKGGIYAQAMRAYLEWLQETWLEKDAAGLVQELVEAFEEIRNSFSGALQGKAHARVPEALAHLYLGHQFFLQFAMHYGFYTEPEAQAQAEKLYSILLNMGEAHAELSYTDKPSIKFLSVLRELIQSKAVYIHNKESDWEPASSGNCPFLGYCDEEYYYLFSETAYKEVARFCMGQGGCFPVGSGTLWKHLEGDGFLVVEQKNGRTDRTPRRTICGKRQRFLILPKGKVEEHERISSDE